MLVCVEIRRRWECGNKIVVEGGGEEGKRGIRDHKRIRVDALGKLLL